MMSSATAVLPSVYSSRSLSKLYVPVAPISVIYTQFDHVSGVAAGRGQRGISVSKVRILNTLIDRLVSMKSSNKDAILQKAQKAFGMEPNDEQIDAMIESFQAQIKQAVDTATLPQYELGGAAPSSGEIFAISA